MRVSQACDQVDRVFEIEKSEIKLTSAPVPDETQARSNISSGAVAPLSSAG